MVFTGNYISAPQQQFKIAIYIAAAGMQIWNALPILLYETKKLADFTP